MPTDLPAQLAAWRAVCEGATKAPWTARMQRGDGNKLLGVIIEHGNGRIGWSSYATARPNAGEETPYPIGAANGELISLAVNLFPKLLTAVEAAGLLVDELLPRLTRNDIAFNGYEWEALEELQGALRALTED